MDFEIKELSFKADAIDLEEGTFTGHASTFGNIDEQGDVIEKGAFKKTLKEAGGMVKILRDHSDIIGKPLELIEDDKGLRVKGRISKTALGLDTLTLMRDGVLDALSIGFNTIKSTFDKEKNIRYIKEVKLWEFSVVPWGANTQARIEAVKAARIKALGNNEPPGKTRLDPDMIQSLRYEMGLLNKILIVR